MKNKIAVFTGTRADYGLLLPLIRLINGTPSSELQLLVGGTHFSPEFGSTIKQIENDGFNISAKIEMLLSSDSDVGIAKAMGLAMISAAENLERLKPDVLVVLGDRFETFAIAQTAMIARVPIAHIHGGEITQGAMDESIRHAISKLSHMHFTSTERYRARLVQLGENPELIFNVGAPGIDNISKLSAMPLSEISESLDIELNPNSFFLVTHHPVTLIPEQAQTELGALFKALDRFQDHKVIITYPNADQSGKALINMILSYAHNNKGRVVVSPSLGQQRYLSLMKYSTAVIGNSSSGIIEAPSFGVPSINIGDRQEGRISAESTLHCNAKVEFIVEHIDKALTPEFRTFCRQVENPYGNGGSSERIFNTISQLLPFKNIKKPFFDISAS
ncbi:UDP-N-acetylglucosamine 2-epimerase (hydrolyzing) [Catenovulum sp. SM1970]|uniref:UDP-N-acetylglucosamine 2-epimerase n=1 Tax=Marinifaba aquimaris TaxID=2741323 RepID=UPI001571FCEB|nr:UDP-N-acetylglucosamine 2-epimerase [Marinifaba aquimaris]NTS75365.1 UDP-N-acetylglucosamine 2-epimerase (hydrolyzing) [Marinifaba aquimaris]